MVVRKGKTSEVEQDRKTDVVFHSDLGRGVLSDLPSVEPVRRRRRDQGQPTISEFMILPFRSPSGLMDSSSRSEND